MTATFIADVGQATAHHEVLKQLVWLSNFFIEDEAQLLSLFEKAMATDSDELKLQLAHTLGLMNSEKAQGYWMQLAKTFHESELFAEALVSGLTGKEKEMHAQLSATLHDTSPLIQTLESTLDNIANNKSQKPEFYTETFLDGRTQSAKNYTKFCATCHGQDGMGIEGLAPPLYESEFIKGSAEQLILIVLHGLQGPVTVKGKLYDNSAAMPGIKNNPELSDKEIAGLLRFIINGFASSGPSIGESKVTTLREQTKDQEEMWTVKSLNEWLEQNTEK